MVDLGRHGGSGRYWSGQRLSRAERLEIISLVAAVGINECSAWIISVLERGNADAD